MVSSEPGRSGRTLTVSQFVRSVKRIVETGLHGCIVEGEISGFVRASSGHCYFKLKDAGASLDCVLFRSRVAHLDGQPSNGDMVQIAGTASVYEPRGQLQFVVNSLQPVGAGALHEMFLRVKRKLQAEGLFDAERKRPIPAWPSRVGVVTSAEGAALQDVLRALARRMPSVPVVIYPTLTQGNLAPGRIVAALGAAAKHARCDTLILCRGGGSPEDLAAYNDEGVARAVAASPIPIISGVGHQTDETIADYAADLRAATPTAAAEHCVPDRRAELKKVALLAGALARRTLARCGNLGQRLDYAQRSLADPRRELRRQTELLGRCAARMMREPARRITSARERLSAWSRLMGSGAPPVRILGGGLAELGRRLARAAGACRSAFAHRAESAAARLLLAAGKAHAAHMRGGNLAELERRLTHAAQMRSLSCRDALRTADMRLHALDYRKTLGRGFSMVWGETGALVRAAGELRPGERVRIRFGEGEARARVEGGNGEE